MTAGSLNRPEDFADWRGQSGLRQISLIHPEKPRYLVPGFCLAAPAALHSVRELPFSVVAIVRRVPGNQALREVFH
jgi:hypothetical protein